MDREHLKNQLVLLKEFSVEQQRSIEQHHVLINKLTVYTNQHSQKVTQLTKNSTAHLKESVELNTEHLCVLQEKFKLQQLYIEDIYKRLEGITDSFLKLLDSTQTHVTVS